jgi:hypothetical protein
MIKMNGTVADRHENWSIELINLRSMSIERRQTNMQGRSFFGGVRRPNRSVKFVPRMRNDLSFGFEVHIVIPSLLFYFVVHPKLTSMLDPYYAFASPSCHFFTFPSSQHVRQFLHLVDSQSVRLP